MAILMLPHQKCAKHVTKFLSPKIESSTRKPRAKSNEKQIIAISVVTHFFNEVTVNPVLSVSIW